MIAKNYLFDDFLQKEMARTSSAVQLNLVLQVLHLTWLFSNFEEQKEFRSMDMPVSTIALHTEHLIKRDAIFTIPLLAPFQVQKVF